MLCDRRTTTVRIQHAAAGAKPLPAAAREKPASSNEDPAQPKMNDKVIKKKDKRRQKTPSVRILRTEGISGPHPL